MKIIHTFEFAAAHHLPYVARSHKCRRVHGHTYTVRLEMEGHVDQSGGLRQGMVLDFSRVKELWVDLLHLDLDHHDLNDLLRNPTAENLALLIADRLVGSLPLTAVEVWETPHSAARWEA